MSKRKKEPDAKKTVALTIPVPPEARGFGLAAGRNTTVDKLVLRGSLFRALGAFSSGGRSAAVFFLAAVIVSSLRPRFSA